MGAKTTMKSLLSVKNVKAKVGDKQILNGLNLEIKKGEVHVIMGPNGAGKSTLANVIFNNPLYKKTSGKIVFDGKDITNAKVDEVARSGIFMSFQSPEEISGVSVFNFIKTAKGKMEDKNVNYFDFKEELEKDAKALKMKNEMTARDLNVGFSGGEKKKNEILQMLMLKPKLAILDETDSGLDVDAIRTVSKGIEMFKNDDNAVLIITHSTKILQALKVDFVHILVDGKIVCTGDASLAKQVEKSGYEKFKAGAKNA